MTYLEAQAQWYRTLFYLYHMLYRQRNDIRRSEYVEAVKFVRSIRERMEKEQ